MNACKLFLNFSISVLALFICSNSSAANSPSIDSKELQTLCDAQEQTATLFTAYEQLHHAATDDTASDEYHKAAALLHYNLAFQIETACRGGVPQQFPIHVNGNPTAPCTATIGRDGEDGKIATICLTDVAPLPDPPTAVAQEIHVQNSDNNGVTSECEVTIAPGVTTVPWQKKEEKMVGGKLSEKMGEPFVVYYTDVGAWTKLTDTARSNNTTVVDAKALFVVNGACEVASLVSPPLTSDATLSVTLPQAQRESLVKIASDIENAIIDYNKTGRLKIMKRLKQAEKRWNRLSKFGYPENMLESFANGAFRKLALRDCPKVGQEYACDNALDPGRLRIILIHPSVGVQLFDSGSVNGDDPTQVRPVFFGEVIGANYYLPSFKWYFGMGVGVQISNDGIRSDFRPGVLLHLTPFVDVGISYSNRSDGATFSLNTDLIRLLQGKKQFIPKTTFSAL